MVDAGSRAASVTIHRVMDAEHGLDNVTGEIMLNTLLNQWIKYCGKPNVVRTDPERAFRDQEVRRGLDAKSIRLDSDPGTRPGKHWIPSNSQQYVWLEEVLTVSQFKKSLINALLLTMTHIEIEDSLRGSWCWRRSCKTASACEGSVVQSVHRRRTVTSKTSQRESSSPTLEALGSK